jgi:crotonobetaine/carnitine-CoA ligase
MTPPHDLWTLCLLRTEAHPERVILDFDGRHFTWAELTSAAESCAGGLSAAGVAPGDVVCHMADNNEEVIVTMLALLRLGAIECPVNAGLKGDQLGHVLRHSGARTLVVDGSLIDRVAAQLPATPDLGLLVRRGDGETPPGMRVLDYREVRDSGETAPPFTTPDPGSPMNIIYTSGTTGPAKGAVLPHAFPLQQARIKIDQWNLSDADIMFSALPLYHVNARFSTLGTSMVADGRAALVPRFSAGQFWDQVRTSGATEVGVVGAISSILFLQEPAASDRDHNVRMMHGAAGVPVDRRAEFEDRFGLRLVTGFAMTETGHFSTTDPEDPMRFRASGRAVPEYELAIVDEMDDEVKAGTVGELVVRPRAPWVMMTGYHRQPDATLAAFTNLWFHTGDLATIEDDGYLRWVDRKKDAIRRRGEMISSTEVERAVLAFPGVIECAAVGVEAALGEEDVKIVVVAQPGDVIDLPVLALHCRTQLPDFAAPRYLEQMTALPKGATHKVEKHKLRALDGDGIVDLEASDPSE